MKKMYALLQITILGVAVVMLFAGCRQTPDLVFSGGKGTLADPFQISTAEDLLFLSENVSETNEQYHYILTDDIDMTDRTWTPIGRYISERNIDTRAFRGTLDGNGHVIENLMISTTEKKSEDELLLPNIQTAFIGFAIGSKENPTVIKDLTLKNINVNFDSSGYDKAYVTSLIGIAGTREQPHVKIENCKVTGRIKGGNGYSSISGLVGENCGEIANCMFEGVLEDVTSEWKSPNISGFVAFNSGIIDQCHTKCDIIVSSKNSYHSDFPAMSVSGFAGLNGSLKVMTAEAIIKNSSTSGRMIATNNAEELVGENRGTVENCVADMEFMESFDFTDASL